MGQTESHEQGRTNKTQKQGGKGRKKRTNRERTNEMHEQGGDEENKTLFTTRHGCNRSDPRHTFGTIIT